MFTHPGTVSIFKDARATARAGEKTFKTDITQNRGWCNGIYYKKLSKLTAQSIAEKNGVLYASIPNMIQWCRLGGAWGISPSPKMCAVPGHGHNEADARALSVPGEALCTSIQSKMMQVCEQTQTTHHCKESFYHYIHMTGYSSRQPPLLIVTSVESMFEINVGQTWHPPPIAVPNNPPPNNNPPPTTGTSNQPTYGTNQNEICFARHNQPSARNTASFKEAMEELTRRRSGGLYYVDDGQRTIGIKLFAKSFGKTVLDKVAHPYAYKKRVDMILDFLDAALHDVHEDERGDIIQHIVHSKTFKARFGKFGTNTMELWKEFQTRLSAEVYYSTTIGKTAYVDLYQKSVVPKELQQILGNPKLFASYDRVRLYGNEHYKNNLDKDIIKTSAKIFGPQTAPVTGAMLSMIRTISDIVNEAESFETFEKYHEKQLLKNFVVLEKVKFNTNIDMSNVPWPSEFSFEIKKIRTFLCTHTSLSTFRDLCDPTGKYRKTKVAISKPAGLGAHTQTPNVGVVYDIVVLLEIGPDDWNMLKDHVLSDGGTLVGAARGNQRRVEKMVAFQPTIPIDYSAMCDADASYIATRAGAQTGQASYTNTFCGSSAWRDGIHKLFDYQAITQIFPGDDKLKYTKQFMDAIQGRARLRRQLTTVIYDKKHRPIVLNTRYVTDSKAHASFGGGNAANVRCGHVPGFGCCRDDTNSVTEYDQMLCNEIDWEETGCAASRLYELHGLIKSCCQHMRINLGMEVVMAHITPCIDAMNTHNRNADDVKAACEPIYKAHRSKFKKGDRSTSLTPGRTNGILSIATDSHPVLDAFRQALINTFNCELSEINANANANANNNANTSTAVSGPPPQRTPTSGRR